MQFEDSPRLTDVKLVHFYCCDYFVLINSLSYLQLLSVVLGLVCSVLGQEIGWEERLRNDVICIYWYVNLNSAVT